MQTVSFAGNSNSFTNTAYLNFTHARDAKRMASAILQFCKKKTKNRKKE